MTDSLIRVIRTSPLILFIALTSASPGHAQPPDRSVLETLTESHLRPSLEVFREFLRIPNDGHYPEHVEQNMQWMERALTRRRFTTRRLKTAGAPLLLADRPAAGTNMTLLIYLHVDGQPVDPSRWDQESPYEPVLKENVGRQWREIPWERLSGELDPEWRIFARSSSDAKGAVMMFLTALDAFQEGGWKQSFNLKVIMDFEEEMGSPNLPPAVPVHREALQADMLIMLDGPRHYSNRPTLTFGARGIATLELIVHGARVAQHSGHFGNYAPNPAYEAFRTPLNSPLGIWLTGALERAFGAKPVRIRMSGGSIPMAPFIRTLNTPAVMIPTVNSDNNQHSPNENLRIGNYQEGILTFLAVLTEPFPL